MKKSQKIACGGLITALAIVLMISSNLIPSLLFSLPALAVLVIYTLSVVSGSGYALISYAAVSLLSFFFCGSKAVSLCFILFLGYYPLLKKQIEKLRSRLAAYIVKLLVFNAAAAAVYALLTFVFSSPVFTRWLGEKWLIIPLIFALNIVFLLFDICLTMFFKKYEKIIYNIVTKLIGRF